MKILIFTASTGGGHKVAAAALENAFHRISPEDQVMLRDGLALTGKLYNHLICDGYTFLAKNAPDFYGTIYKISDKESPLNKFCNIQNKAKGNKLLPVIHEFNPDVIISCHAFVTIMLDKLKEDGEITTPVISQITDFSPHYTYVVNNIDHFIVSSDEMVDMMTNKYKLPAKKVHPFGIPVAEKFLEPCDRNAVARDLGLKENTPTILFMAGSFGVSKILKLYEEISQMEPDAQYIVITGNNKKLYHKFESIVGDNTKLLMYVDNVNDYMHCADLIITKPGGLTVSESIHCALPMAIYNAFPGQEEENAKFLLKSGVAVILQENPAKTISTLLSKPEILQEMSNNCKGLCQGNSCEQIINLAHSIGKKESEK